MIIHHRRTIYQYQFISILPQHLNHCFNKKQNDLNLYEIKRRKKRKNKIKRPINKINKNEILYERWNEIHT